MANTTAHDVELSIVIPCLNEARTLAVTVGKALAFLSQHGVTGEVVVSDNGSTDGSSDIAKAAGARVVQAMTRGYGAAVLQGIASARGKYVLMGDADDSYDFSALVPFVEKLREGFELVMGNRMQGGIEKGAMPWHHRYVGNPVLSGIGRMLFGSPCGDFHCGLRAFRKSAVERLALSSTGMEFASEMVVKAALFDLRVTEVPTRLHRDGRNRRPHLRSVRDGWRHLRLLLVYSPRWLFIYPGLLLMAAGLLLVLWLLPHPRAVGDLVFDGNTLLFAATAVILGYQSAIFGVLTKVYTITAKITPHDPRCQRLFHPHRLELGLSLGALLFVGGLATAFVAVTAWGKKNFGPLELERTVRLVIPSALLMTIGSQTILGSFFLGVMRLGEEK